MDQRTQTPSKWNAGYGKLNLPVAHIIQNIITASLKWTEWVDSTECNIISEKAGYSGRSKKEDMTAETLVD